MRVLRLLSVHATVGAARADLHENARLAAEIRNRTRVAAHRRKFVRAQLHARAQPTQAAARRSARASIATRYRGCASRRASMSTDRTRGSVRKRSIAAPHSASVPSACRFRTCKRLVTSPTSSSLARAVTASAAKSVSSGSLSRPTMIRISHAALAGSRSACCPTQAETGAATRSSASQRCAVLDRPMAGRSCCKRASHLFLELVNIIRGRGSNSSHFSICRFDLNRA